MASRSRSRSPIQRSESVARSGNGSPAPSSTSGTDKPLKKYHMTMNSIPLSWTYHQVSGYIRKHTNKVDKAIAENICYIHLTPNPKYPGLQLATISFKNEDSRHQAYNRLKTAPDKIEGRKLYVNIKSRRIMNPMKLNLKKEKLLRKPFPYQTLPLMDLNGEENEMYGLSAGYLEDLGITSRPLTRWVFVRGLPEVFNNEEKLRDAFGKAGHVESVAIIESKSGGSYNARIEYDHPVEAVQAVSMFNKREVMGRTIQCEMDFLRKKEFVDGVTQGPGLGPDGKPMRGIRISVECKKFKNEFMQEIAKINDSLDELKAQVTNLFMEVENVKTESKNALAVQNTANQNVSNPLAALGNILTNQLQPMLLQGLVQQSTGNDLSQLGSLLQNLSGGNMNLSNLLQKAQTGANIQSGSNFQSGPDNMQRGPDNMQNGPSNMPGGSNNMQAGPSNMHAGPSNMQSGPNNMQAGPSNMQGGPNNMQGGPSYMQSGPNNMQMENSYDSYDNMQSGPQNQGKQNPFNQTNNPGFNTPNQPNQFGNLQQQSNFDPTNQMNLKQKFMKCFKCGGMGHKAHGCQNTKKNVQSVERKSGFDLKLCHKCSKPGHLAHECWKNTKTNNQGPNQNNNQQQAGGMGNSTMLLFKNLPPVVTYQVLQGKMLEVGEVKMVEMTGPGRALVNFSYPQDADKCIRLFNESKVDGQIILVNRV